MHILTTILLGEMLLGSRVSSGRAPYELVHVLPGRLRVKVRKLKGDEVLERRLGEALGALQSVDKVHTEGRTGSVLIQFQDNREVREAIIETLTRLTGGEGEAPLLPGGESGDGPLLRRRVNEFAAWMDRGILQQTGGVADLTTLAGMASFIWGGKIILHPGQGSRWQGLTLVYWSYNMLRNG